MARRVGRGVGGARDRGEGRLGGNVEEDLSKRGGRYVEGKEERDRAREGGHTPHRLASVGVKRSQQTHVSSKLEGCQCRSCVVGLYRDRAPNLLEKRP